MVRTFITAIEIALAIAVPDEPFDAEELLVFDGVPVSRGELRQIQLEMRRGVRRRR